jgi:hypothetical protein
VESRLTTDYRLTRHRLNWLMRNRTASTEEIRGQIRRATVLFEHLILGDSHGDARDAAAVVLPSTDERDGEVMGQLLLRQLSPQLPPGGAVATYQRVLQLRDIKRSVHAIAKRHKAAARLQYGG